MVHQLDGRMSTHFWSSVSIARDLELDITSSSKLRSMISPATLAKLYMNKAVGGKGRELFPATGNISRGHLEVA